MGTVVEITLVGKDEAKLNAAAEAAFAEIQRLEALMSHYREDSDVARINNAAGKEAVAVSKETFEVIEVSLNASRLTNGAFDVTMGVLVKAWRFTPLEGIASKSDEYINRTDQKSQGPLTGFTKDDKGELTPPSAEEVKKLLPLVDYRQIMIDKQNNTVKLAKQGMRINLGGVAKGYIVGKAVEVLKKNGITRGMVHAGGDMIVFTEPDSPPWLIGIQDPRNKDNIVGTIKVSNTAIATSGDYERFFIKDGKRYHHIINPSTGFPANKSMAVTIVTKDPALADALSTGIFVMGLVDGMKLIEELPDAEGLIIGADGKMIVSSGLQGKIEFASGSKSL